MSMPYERSEEQRDELVERVAREIQLRGLTGPAVHFLEASRPYRALGANAMLFFDPVLRDGRCGRCSLAPASPLTAVRGCSLRCSRAPSPRPRRRLKPDRRLVCAERALRPTGDRPDVNLPARRAKRARTGDSGRFRPLRRRSAGRSAR
jgi:hypothetical protein